MVLPVLKLDLLAQGTTEPAASITNLREWHPRPAAVPGAIISPTHTLLFSMTRPRPLLQAIGLMAGLVAMGVQPAAGAAPVCTFLQPIGGNGITPIVSKRVGRGKLLGKPNWNTDFIVDQPYGSYKLFFTATSSDPSAKYPVSGFMKFSDNTTLQLFSETISPPIGSGKMYGPFPAVPGKQASQINFKIGATDDPNAMGFSYRISVQGCS
jgi:hypothetical protein